MIRSGIPKGKIEYKNAGNPAMKSCEQLETKTPKVISAPNNNFKNIVFRFCMTFSVPLLF